MSLSVVDLFCGAGGFSEGARSVDPSWIEIVAAFDIDQALGNTWTLNHPDTQFIQVDLSFDKINSVWNRARKAGLGPGNVDIVLASPPCQKLSAAGKREPEDPSNTLFVSVLRAVERWKPKALLLENVPRFFTAYRGAFIEACQRALRDAGYISQWSILNAANYGVPQFRKRGFLIALERSFFKGRPLFPEPSHFPGGTPVNGRLPAPTRKVLATPTVEDSIGDLPALKAGEGEEPIELTSEPISQFQRERRCGGQELVFNHRAWGHSADMVARIRMIEEGVAPQMVNSHPAKPRSYFRQAYARLDRKEPANTITTNFHNPGSGRFIHYRDHRTLTVREAARLQTFDDRYRFSGTQSEASVQVGNAVPPILARALIARTIEFFDG